VIGDVGNQALVTDMIGKHAVSEIIHFAASIVVPDSVRDPLGYYRNNTMNARALLEVMVKTGIRRFIFSSTAAVYGNPTRVPVAEADPLAPMSPYGSSKLMTEIMLRDTAAAHGLDHVILRYFNVAGADPQLRTGQSTLNATHLIKVAVETALGLRPQIDVYGTDYATPDGTCIRDYIHVSDLVRAHSAALAHLRSGGTSETLNCGYGHGASVLEVIAAVKRVSGREFAVRMSARRPGDPAAIVADAQRIRTVTGWQPRYDDLDTIVRHAFAWERELMRLRPRGAAG
jgi:UDP-glucose 4-epimerase